MSKWRIPATLALTSLLAACTGETNIEERTQASGNAPADGVSSTEPSQPGNDAPPPPTGAPSGSPDGGASDGGGPAKADGGAPDDGGTGGGTPSPFDAFQQKNLDEINAYRATLGVAPVALDLKLSAFALEGSKQLSIDHVPHNHFETASDNGTIWQAGFKGSAGENQGDPNGWYQMANDPKTNEMLQIAAIQKAMFDEGPGSGPAHGHYMTMMDAKYKRVGVGLLMVGTKLYLTNDYSE